MDHKPIMTKQNVISYLWFLNKLFIPVSMIVGHVLIFTEAAASLERRILVRC